MTVVFRDCANSGAQVPDELERTSERMRVKTN